MKLKLVEGNTRLTFEGKSFCGFAGLVLFLWFIYQCLVQTFLLFGC